jgi:hypothetical protein
MLLYDFDKQITNTDKYLNWLRIPLRQVNVTTEPRQLFRWRMSLSWKGWRLCGAYDASYVC